MSFYSHFMSLSSQNKKNKKTKENKIKMGYFKPRNMHLLEHDSNQKNFKPKTQEHKIVIVVIVYVVN